MALLRRDIVAIAVALAVMAGMRDNPLTAAEIKPTAANVSYGPHEHQVLDVYLPPEGDGPSPALIWYGGIWKPAKHPANLNYFGKQGVAVIAVETRTMTDAVADKVQDPIEYVMLDACRAVQFVRHNASQWKIDPSRIAVGGGSQGAMPALYVGCAGEKAKPESNDPVERHSTQVSCVAAYRSQPTLDPRRMQEWEPGVKWGSPAFGCLFEESLARRDELQPRIAKWSPDYLLHKDAAPIYFENNWDLVKPDTVTEMDYKVHSPNWGLGFQKLAQQAGVPCHVKYPGHSTDGYADIWDFVAKELKAKQ